MDFLITNAYFILSYILKGFVLKKLWFWFVVPTFSVPTLHLTVAIGLVLIAGLCGNTFEKYLEHNKQARNEAESAYVGAVLFGQLYLRPVAILCFGWMLHVMQLWVV